MSEIDKVPKRLSEHIDYMKNAGGQKHLESFKKDFDSFHRLYKSLELTILAYKSGSIWINLGSQFKLSPIENTARTKFTKNYITDELILVKSRTGVKELWKFVKDLALGVIEVEHLLVYTKKESNSHFFGPTYSLFNKTSALGKRNIPYQTSILQWTGNALSDIIVDLPILERNLGNLAKPIESINDLFRSKLDFGVEDLYSASRQSSFAEILAPTYASLADEIELDNNTLRIKLNVGTKNLFQKTKLSIGIKTGNDTRFTVKGDKLGLKTLGKSLSLTIQNTKFSGRTVLFLRLFGSEIDRVDFDPSFVSSRCFFRNLFDNWDSELKKIEKKFVKIGETLNDSEFERLITGTLILSGFVSAPLGMIFPNSGVSDGICISPGSKEVLIYECTIGSPSIPKIENLGKRLKNVKSQCPDLNFNALLFTFSLTSDLDENQKSFATKADVAVIGIKEIEDLIKKEIKNLMMEDFNSWIVMQKARHIPLSALR